MSRPKPSFFAINSRYYEGLIFVAAFFWLVVAIHFQSRAWVDEHWVVQEPAAYLMGLASALPADWHYEIRSVLPPFLLFAVLKVLGFLGLHNGLWVLPFTRVLMAGATFLSLLHLFATLKQTFGLRQKPWVAALVVFFLPELVHYASFYDLSVLASPFLFLGFSLLLRARESRAKYNSSYLWGWVLLVFSTLIRFQFGVFAVVFFFWEIFHRRYQKAAQAALIGFLALGLLIVSDSLFYGKPVFSLLNYFTVNTFGKMAASFGTTPFYFGFELLWRFATEAVVLFFFLTLRTSVSPKGMMRPLVFSTVLYFGAHCLIGHKEYRFFYTPAVLFSVIAAFSVQKNFESGKKIFAALFLVLFVVFAGFRGIKKVGWSDYEVPSYLETVAGSQDVVRGLLSYGWGGIYSGGNFTFYRNLPYLYAESRKELQGRRLNASLYNAIVAPSSEPGPCRKILARHRDAVLYLCDSGEMNRFLN